MTFQEFFARWWFSFSNVGTRYFLMAGIVFTLFYIIFKNPMMGRKIQPKFPQMSDYGRDIFYSLLSMVIFGVVSVITFGILKPYINVYYDINDYPMPYYYFTFIWMFLPRCLFLLDASVYAHPKSI